MDSSPPPTEQLCFHLCYRMSFWDFFWNELIWIRLFYKQFSNATKNIILSSSEIIAFDFFVCMFLLLTLMAQKCTSPLPPPWQIWDAKEQWEVAFREAFPENSLLQFSSSSRIFRQMSSPELWPVEDLSNCCSQLLFVVLLLLEGFYLVSHCLP